MEPTKWQSDEFKEHLSKISSSRKPEGTEMHRDNESIDDFEHLEPESSPVKEFQDQGPQNKVPLGDENLSQSVGTLIDSATPVLGDGDFVKSSKLPEKTTFSQQPHDLLGFSAEASVKPETESLISTGEKHGPESESEFDIGKISSQKTLTQAFMDTERGDIITEGSSSHKDILSMFEGDVDFLKFEMKPADVPKLDAGNIPSDNYPTDDITSSFSHDFEKRQGDFQDFDKLLNPPKSDIKHTEKLSDEIGSSKYPLNAQDDDDLSQEEPEPEDKPTTPVPASTHPKLTPSAPEPMKPVAVVPGPSVKAETIAAVEPNVKPLPDKLKTSAAVGDSELEETSHCMGLDAWFKPERLHPRVVELVYWRDPRKSGIVLGTVLGVLLSLSYFSLISVVAYLSLAALTGTFCFRIYKNCLQAMQKTSDGHPFKDILELDLTLPQDKVREVTDIAMAHVNAAALELRRLFLVEDFFDSMKFGVLLWCLTYVGSWFNGMTLIIIAFVALFTLPKLYELNRVKVDQNLEFMLSSLADLKSKVMAAVPLGKKPTAEGEKKEQ